MAASVPEMTPEQLRIREDRRWAERMRTGRATPAGVWDDDLDKWQGAGYISTFHEDYEGYKVIVCRSPWLSWNVYVQVPAGHIANAVTHYDFFNRNQDGMMPAPFELSYGGASAAPLPIRMEGGGGAIFGFDHCYQSRDLMPRHPGPFGPAAVFTTREMAKEEGVQLMKYFFAVNRDNVPSILRSATNYCEQCCEFKHEKTTLVEGKNCCTDCVPAARKEAVDARIAAADARKMPYELERERAAVRASEAAAANKGDAANAGAIYAAMMAKKRAGKGKGGGGGGKKGGRK
jgi:hypothetical protein